MLLKAEPPTPHNLQRALRPHGVEAFVDVAREGGLGAGLFQTQLMDVLVRSQVVLVLVTPAPSGPDKPEDGGLYLGEPTALKRFLGCDYNFKTVTRPDGTTIRHVDWGMESSLRDSLKRYCELTHQSVEDLVPAKTPFLDEDQLRRRHGIVQAPQSRRRDLRTIK